MQRTVVHEDDVGIAIPIDIASPQFPCPRLATGQFDGRRKPAAPVAA